MRRRQKASFCACLALAAAFLCTLPGPACARRYYSWEKKPEKTFFIRTRIKRWQAATAMKTKSARLIPSSWLISSVKDARISGTSDFKGMDAPLYLFSAEVQPLRGFSLEFETGDNRFSGGSYLERGQLRAAHRASNGITWESPATSDYYRARADTSGTARQYAASAYLTVYKTDGRAQDSGYEIAHSLDLFICYSWARNNVRIGNSYTTLSAYGFLAAPPAVPATVEASRVRMAWYGWRAGFREQAVLGRNFFAESSLSYGPGVKYRGDYYWKLDPSLAEHSIRSSATGQMTEFSISVSYKFWKQFEIAGGWLTWAYKASSGQENRYYADGSALNGDLTRVEAARKGAFFGLSWKY